MEHHLPDGNVDPVTQAELFDFKKSLYGGFSATQAFQVRSGAVDPVVQGTIEDAPPSVYWHWEIPAANLAGFEAAAGLPAGLSLAPSELEAGDGAAAQWLTLHVYRDTGGVDEGLRAEWSTHRRRRRRHPPLDPRCPCRPSGARPDRRAERDRPVHAGDAADPCGRRRIVRHDRRNGCDAFTSSFAAPAGGGSTVLPDRGWVGANDLRYWQNGVADRCSTTAPRSTRRSRSTPGTVTVTDGGQWTQYASSADPDRVWVDRRRSTPSPARGRSSRGADCRKRIHRGQAPMYSYWLGGQLASLPMSLWMADRSLVPTGCDVARTGPGVRSMRAPR